MNKKQLKGWLQDGKPLKELLDFKEGQECLIYKTTFENSNEIIYIPDMSLNEIVTNRALDEAEIAVVINNCYSGHDFIEISLNNEEIAKSLFEYVDWQHPSSDLIGEMDEPDSCRIKTQIERD